MANSAVLWVAHAGHWTATLAYFAPVLAFLAWTGMVNLRERRGTAAVKAKRSKERSGPRDHLPKRSPGR